MRLSSELKESKRESLNAHLDQMNPELDQMSHLDPGVHLGQLSRLEPESGLYQGYLVICPEAKVGRILLHNSSQFMLRST
jgi:hypothetical protein